jgi:DNA-binding transcriptional MerR regulator
MSAPPRPEHGARPPAGPGGGGAGAGAGEAAEGKLDVLFAVREVARICDLNESRIRYWAQTGFINPSGSRGGKRLYTFRDLVAIRAARGLLDGGVPLQEVRRSLQALRAALPELDLPLSRLRVRSDASGLVVAPEDGGAFEPKTGQLLLDFGLEELRTRAAELLALPATAPASPSSGAVGSSPAAGRAGGRIRLGSADGVEQAGAGPGTGGDAESAYAWFQRGCALDEAGALPAEVAKAYERALALDPSLASAHTNLGNLHHAQGERAEARRCYEMACMLEPDQPEALYNLGNLDEEEGDLETAIEHYRRAVSLAPDFADAHYNLAIALEHEGSRVQSARHLRRFLELAGPAEETEGGDAFVREARARIAALEAKDP